MTSMTDNDPRVRYIAGLRAVADLLEATPDLPLPTTEKLEWAAHDYAFTQGGDERDWIAKIARLIPGTLTKNDPTASSYHAAYFLLSGNVGGMPVEVWAERPKVCTRVVTGQREVTKTVPTATTEVTVTEDVVEWVCSPLLAERVGLLAEHIA